MATQEFTSLGANTAVLNAGHIPHAYYSGRLSHVYRLTKAYVAETF